MSSSTRKDSYQDLQRIYLDWHEGRRPFSGFIKAIQTYFAAAEREARIDELKYLLEDFGVEDNVQPIKDRLSQLQSQSEVQ